MVTQPHSIATIAASPLTAPVRQNSRCRDEDLERGQYRRRDDADGESG